VALIGPGSRSERQLQDERDYIAAAKQGDRAAFDALLGPLIPALRARVRGALQSRSDLDPDEIVQQTLVRSFQAIGVFDERYQFRQYAFGIAKYILRRHLCSTSREVAVAWDEAPDDPNGVRVPGPDALSDAARALIGVDRFPPPDRHAVDRTRLRELIEAVMLHGGYPHQLIAFAYATVLWGKRNADPPPPRRSAKEGTTPSRSRPGKVPITSDPDRVARELSGTPLFDAGRLFRREIEVREGLAAPDLDPAFAPLEYRMGLRVEQLFAMDPVSLRRHAAMNDCRVGATRLSDYYGQNPRKSIADWIAAVKTKTEKYLTGRLDRTRISLPMPGDPDNPGRHAVEERGREDRVVARLAGPPPSGSLARGCESRDPAGERRPGPHGEGVPDRG
jgi:DNA-directed RNA polymerase specialized sigma24 family protein